MKYHSRAAKKLYLRETLVGACPESPKTGDNRLMTRRSSPTALLRPKLDFSHHPGFSARAISIGEYPTAQNEAVYPSDQISARQTSILSQEHTAA